MRKDEVQQTPARPHNLTLTGRKKANITGVYEVDSFNDEIVVLKTSEGELSIAGQDLHIAKLNLDEGELIVEGTVVAFEYGDTQPAHRRGLWRVLR